MKIEQTICDYCKAILEPIRPSIGVQLSHPKGVATIVKRFDFCNEEHLLEGLKEKFSESRKEEPPNFA